MALILAKSKFDNSFERKYFEKPSQKLRGLGVQSCLSCGRIIYWLPEEVASGW